MGDAAALALALGAAAAAVTASAAVAAALPLPLPAAAPLRGRGDVSPVWLVSVRLSGVPALLLVPLPAAAALRPLALAPAALPLGVLLPLPVGLADAVFDLAAVAAAVWVLVLVRPKGEAGWRRVAVGVRLSGCACAPAPLETVAEALRPAVDVCVRRSGVRFPLAPPLPRVETVRAKASLPLPLRRPNTRVVVADRHSAAFVDRVRPSRSPLVAAAAAVLEAVRAKAPGLADRVRPKTVADLVRAKPAAGVAGGVLVRR